MTRREPMTVGRPDRRPTDSLREVRVGELPIDDEHAALYSVGQVAAMLAVRQAFLRRLDEFDVVRPHRSPGGQRRYSRHDIGRVRHVVHLAGEGMSLAAIRRILELELQVKMLNAELEATRLRLRGPAG